MTESECKEPKPAGCGDCCRVPPFNCAVCRQLLASLVLSSLMMLTDYAILFFSCRGLKVYGAWLSRHHSVDLWLIRLLVTQMGKSALQSFFWGGGQFSKEREKGSLVIYKSKEKARKSCNKSRPVNKSVLWTAGLQKSWEFKSKE